MLLVVRYELDLINCDLFVRINLSKKGRSKTAGTEV
mgnify:CR=1 FL=1|jgi:hypothetical protein